MSMSTIENAKSELKKYLMQKDNYEVNYKADDVSNNLGQIKNDNAEKFVDLLVELIKAVINDTKFTVPQNKVVIEVMGQATGMKNLTPIEVEKTLP